jgi:glyoxylase-like metal-dependent hydrolase (beta-lactamase superfamily II)
MKRAGILVALVVVGVVAANLGRSQSTPSTGPKVAELQKLKDTLYVISGGGGNTAALITDKGVVVVDTKLAGWGQPILDQIQSVTDKPVIMIINTHTHGDHVGSNEFFPASVEIVAHQNTADNMKRMDALKDKPQAMPDRTFQDKLSLLDGKDRIDLYYFGAGHTNGDTWVVFPSLRVAHAGDMFARKGTPRIDVNNGGSGVAYPVTLEKAVKTIQDVDTVIPGHSAPTQWAAVAEYAEFNRAFLAYVQDAKKAGKTAEQAAAEIKLPEKFSAYAMQTAQDNITAIYAELAK